MAMTVAAVMLAHQVAGKAVRDALFLGRLPVTDLPAMVIVAAAVSVAAVPVYSHLLAWLGPRRLVPAGFLLSGVAHLAEWWWLSAGATVPVLVYVHVAAFGALLMSGFWSLTSELFDIQTAKQQVVRIATAGSVGGMLGGLAVERVGAWASPSSSLLLLAAFHLTCAVLLLPLRASMRGVTQIPAEPLVSRASLATPQVREIAALIVLGTASAAILDYLLKSRAAAEYTGNDLLQFFGVFYTVTQVGTLAFQALLAAPLQRRLGVGRTVTMLPLGVGGGAAAALFFPVTATFAVARFLEQVLRGSLFRSGYELLFSAMSPAEKRRVKTFLDVACDRTGDAVGAGIVQLLLVAGPSFLVSELLGGVLVMVAASLWLGERLDAMYLRSVEQRLVDHGAAHDLAGFSEFGPPSLISLEVPVVQGPATLQDVTPASRDVTPVTVILDEPLELLRRLRSGDGKQVVPALEGVTTFQAMHVAQVVQLLAWDDVTVAARRALERVADRHVGVLTDALIDAGSDFAVRRRIPRVLISAPGQRALDGLLLGLDDTRFEVRYQCSRAMDRMLIAEPALRVDAARIFAIAERELSVARPVWNGYRLLDQFDNADAVMYLDEHLRDRANRSLEHVFSLLVAVLPREPLKVAFRVAHSEDPMLRGLALEYLSGVLPEAVHTRLWERLDASASAPIAAGLDGVGAPLEALLRSQDDVLAQVMRAPGLTRSGDDVPAQSDPPAPATPPSAPR